MRFPHTTASPAFDSAAHLPRYLIRESAAPVSCSFGSPAESGFSPFALPISCSRCSIEPAGFDDGIQGLMVQPALATRCRLCTPVAPSTVRSAGLADQANIMRLLFSLVRPLLFQFPGGHTKLKSSTMICLRPIPMAVICPMSASTIVVGPQRNTYLSPRPPRTWASRYDAVMRPCVDVT